MTGPQLRALRIEQRLSLDEGARRLKTKLGRHVPVSTLANWEAGAMVIPDDVTQDCFAE